METRETTAVRVSTLFAELAKRGWKKKTVTGGNIYWKVTMRKPMPGDREIVIGCHTPGEDDNLHTPIWIEGPGIPENETLCEFHDPTPVFAIAEMANLLFASMHGNLMNVETLFAMESIPHYGAHYYATGKHGTDVATGQASAEFMHEGEGYGRVWLRQDGTVTPD